jgi:hypothetical protein
VLRGDETHVRCARALAARIVLGGERHAVTLAQLLEAHVHERRAVEEHILVPFSGRMNPNPRSLMVLMLPLFMDTPHQVALRKEKSLACLIDQTGQAFP